jgi:hypothetical protein
MIPSRPIHRYVSIARTDGGRSTMYILDPRVTVEEEIAKWERQSGFKALFWNVSRTPPAAARMPQRRPLR